MAFGVPQVVVQHAHENPSRARDGRPTVGVPSELLHRRVLPPVVLDGDTIRAVGEVEARDEASVVEKIAVQFWFGEACPLQDETHLGLAGRLRTATGELEGGGEIGGAVAAQPLGGCPEVFRVGIDARQYRVRRGHERVERDHAAELRPCLGSTRHRESLAEGEVGGIHPNPMPDDPGRARFPEGRAGRDVEVVRGIGGQGEIPDDGGRGVAEELGPSESRGVRMASLEERPEFVIRVNTDAMKRRREVAREQAVRRDAGSTSARDVESDPEV